MSQFFRRKFWKEDENFARKIQSYFDDEGVHSTANDGLKGKGHR